MAKNVFCEITVALTFETKLKLMCESMFLPNVKKLPQGIPEI